MTTSPAGKMLSIVIPVFNKWNFTKSCLTDLAALSEDNHEIIVIDNASSDETQEQIKKLRDDLFQRFPAGCEIHYVRNEENTFHSKACNQGYRLAKGDSVLFLNNDIRIKTNHQLWDKPLIDACYSTSGLVGPTMGQLDAGLNFVREANEQLSGNSYIGGWCVAARKDVWSQLDVDGTGQIWNEEFPMYFNDTDLSFRAKKKNIPLTVVSLPEAVHFGKVSASQINIHKLYSEGRAVFLPKWSKR